MQDGPAIPDKALGASLVLTGSGAMCYSMFNGIVRGDVPRRRDLLYHIIMM